MDRLEADKPDLREQDRLPLVAIPSACQRMRLRFLEPPQKGRHVDNY
jgi:hypothetical protein